MVFLFIVLCVYSFVHGVDNGILYSKRGADATGWNEHIVFVVERALVGLVALAALGTESCMAVGFVLLAWVFAFSFFHNQGYYLMRWYISNTGRYNPFYSSSTSTARIEFDFKTRAALFGVSILIMGTAIYLQP